MCKSERSFPFPFWVKKKVESKEDERVKGPLTTLHEDIKFGLLFHVSVMGENNLTEDKISG